MPIDHDGSTADALRAVVHTIALLRLSLSLQGLGHFPERGEPRVNHVNRISRKDCIAALPVPYDALGGV